MPWNEPGQQQTPRPPRSPQDGPPDFDDIIKGLMGKINRLFGGKTPAPGSAQGGGFVVVLVLALLGLYVAITGFAIVNEQERAVVLRFGVYKETVGPGWRWNPPFVDRVFTENVTRVRLWTTNEQMLTKDLNIVDIKLSVQYSIQDAKSFILNVDDPESTLRQAASSALRHVVGTTVMHNVLTEGRAQLAVDVEKRLQTYLTNYTTGIAIEKVNIEDSNPPKEVQAAFDDVIRAREDEERLKSEAQGYANDVIPGAGGQAKRMIEEANAYQYRVVAEAQGEAKRFEMLLAQYLKAPEVTRNRLYLDAVQEVISNTTKVYVDVKNGNNMMYLPLDKLATAPATTHSTAPRNGLSPSELEHISGQVFDRITKEISSNPRRGAGR